MIHTTQTAIRGKVERLRLSAVVRAAESVGAECVAPPLFQVPDAVIELARGGFRGAIVHEGEAWVIQRNPFGQYRGENTDGPIQIRRYVGTQTVTAAKALRQIGRMQLHSTEYATWGRTLFDLAMVTWYSEPSRSAVGERLFVGVPGEYNPGPDWIRDSRTLGVVGPTSWTMVVGMLGRQVDIGGGFFINSSRFWTTCEYYWQDIRPGQFLQSLAANIDAGVFPLEPLAEARALIAQNWRRRSQGRRLTALYPFPWNP